MMDNDSYNGNYRKNPFNFQYYKLTQIGISVNGEKVPLKPLKLNFDNKLFVTAQGRIQTDSKGSHKPVKQFRFLKQSIKINYQIPDYKNFDFLM